MRNIPNFFAKQILSEMNLEWFFNTLKRTKIRKTNLQKYIELYLNWITCVDVNVRIYVSSSMLHSTYRGGKEDTLSKMGYSALKRVHANSKISSLVPGSSAPN